jgi:hypothetical protein
MTHPPAGPSTPPPPPGPRVGDTIFALAASLGFKDLGHRGPSEPPIPPWVASRRRLAELGVGPVYHGLPKLR